MTGATRCPRFAATSPIAPCSCRPKPARDDPTPGPPRDTSAAARARRLDALRARHAVDGAPACCGAGAGNPGRTRIGARAPSPRSRTTSDTPYTDPAPWRVRSAPPHRAGPLPGRPTRTPLDHDRAARSDDFSRRRGSRSRRGVDHDEGAAEASTSCATHLRRGPACASSPGCPATRAGRSSFQRRY